jgi:FtsP/CotA-like multicopper oxidase with cupredoxin domain
MPVLAAFASLFALVAALMAMPPLQSHDVHTESRYITGCGQVPNSLNILDPPEVKSVNGVASVTLTMAGSNDPLNSTMCYLWTYQSSKGPVTLSDPPTIHVKAGERIVMKLVNTISEPPGSSVHQARLTSSVAPPLAVDREANMSAMDQMDAQMNAKMNSRNVKKGAKTDRGLDNMDKAMQNGQLPCGQPIVPPTPPPPNPQTGRIYGYHRTPWNETNMHFHGLNVSPLAPSDDVVNVLICPVTDFAHANSYTYTLDIPANEPPGNYWYHPHAHGESDHQLLSGLTGVIIVSSVKKSIPDTLPNHVIVVRDVGPAGEARPRWGGGPSPQRIALARQLFAAQNSYHREGGYPYQDPDQCPPPNNNPQDAKELTINHIPLPPNPNSTVGLPTGTIAAGETDYYRLNNTSSDTILDVVATVNGNPVNLMVATRDSVPLMYANGQPTYQPVAFDHILLPPASRFEFYVTGTNPGDQIVFTTLTIDSGCWGDITLQRNLFVLNVTASQGKQQIAKIAPSVSPVKQRFSDLYNVKPVRHRYFAFTEYNAQGDFYITEISNPKAVETPYMGGPPSVVVKDGTVEDWTILNYTQETHMFHIHQIHFLVLQAQNYEVGLGQMLDMVQVPYGVFPQPGQTSGDQMIPGAVTLRMDFREKNIVGEFVYHCHILAHEDGGMMAKIRVDP